MQMYSYLNWFFFFIGNLCIVSADLPHGKGYLQRTQCFPVHSTRHAGVLWLQVVFDPWVLHAIKIPGKIVLLEFSLQFPYMTLCYDLAIVWHLQVAHTWKQKHPKYHPDITTVSLVECSLLSPLLLYLTDLHYKSTSLVHNQDPFLPTEH